MEKTWGTTKAQLKQNWQQNDSLQPSNGGTENITLNHNNDNEDTGNKRWRTTGEIKTRISKIRIDSDNKKVQNENNDKEMKQVERVGNRQIDRHVHSYVFEQIDKSRGTWTMDIGK